MRRRTFAALLAAEAIALPVPLLRAQQRAPRARVGLLFNYGYVPRETDAFFVAMQQLGYVEGRDVAYVRRTGTTDTAARVARQLVDAKPDVIVTSANLNVRALEEATSTIPIVFAVTGDAVENRLVVSLAHPGRNATGLSFQGGELITKRLQLLHEALPALRKVTIFSDPADSPAFRQATERAAQSLGLDLQVLEIPEPKAFDGAFAAAAAANSGAIVVTGGRVITPNRTRFLALASQYRLPTVCHQDTLARAGCLMSYGPSFPDMFRRAAVYVDKILKGAKPGDLPVEQPTKFELVINLKTAKALGLTVPPLLLAQADEVIE